MAIKSYNKSYLPYVAENLGVMLEHITDIGAKPTVFWSKFINSSVAKQIEKGNPKYLTCSALDYLAEIYGESKKIPQKEDINKNEFYWAGWALAQFQYETGYSFYKINSFLSLDQVLKLYPTLHEADITKFIDVAKTYVKKSQTTNLKKARQARELSQSELAKLSGVDLRSIQMYEQRRNDINKAQGETLYKLSKVLGCNIEDLLED